MGGWGGQPTPNMPTFQKNCISKQKELGPLGGRVPGAPSPGSANAYDHMWQPSLFLDMFDQGYGSFAPPIKRRYIIVEYMYAK